MSATNLDVSIHSCRVSVWSLVKRYATEWVDRDRSRRELMQLSAADLRDIGISRCEVESEAFKPFWRP
jgi:uncharacterized protein YjiS (DUF1127 family)